jgi:hypothetical protein
MEQLVLSRPHILSLYRHVLPGGGIDEEEMRLQTEATAPLPHKSTKGTTPPTSKVPSDWLDLVWLPNIKDGAEMGEVLRTILFQATLGAWIGLLALKEDLDLVSYRELSFLRPESELTLYRRYY